MTTRYPHRTHRVGGLEEKLSLLGQLARRGAREPLSLYLARYAIGRVDTRAPVEANGLALCIFIRDNVRYTTEHPETLVGLGPLFALGSGDCDDMVAALSALLIRLAWELRFAVGWQPEPCHVWLRGRAPGSARWLDLDPSTYLVEPGHGPGDAFERVTLHTLEGCPCQD